MSHRGWGERKVLKSVTYYFNGFKVGEGIKCHWDIHKNTPFVSEGEQLILCEWSSQKPGQFKKIN